LSTGFRSNSSRSGTTPAQDWANLPDTYAAIVARFRGVVIEQCDAVELLQRHDGEGGAAGLAGHGGAVGLCP
jgi:DNA adenine methylase